MRARKLQNSDWASAANPLATRRPFSIPVEMKAVRPTPAPIAIQPIGNVRASDLAWLEEVIETVFGAACVCLPSLPLPSDHYDAARRQDDADRLLDLLFHRLPDAALRIVGVLDADMFAAGRTFVFGYAHLRDGMAVYSIARLREEWYGRRASEDLVRSRAYRAVVHELGHTFGNPHCEDPRCVMHAVSQVESLDELSPSYCDSCERRARRGLLVAPSSAEGRFLRGGALLRRRQLQRAALAYREAVSLAPTEARYQNDLGVALLSLGNREEARVAFAKAAELAHDFPHPYYNLGILCRDDGGAEAAAQYFTEGLARDTDPMSAHRYLGRLYEELFGDPRRARQHYMAYVQLGGKEEDVLARAQALSDSR